jgi:hypothetical protein
MAAAVALARGLPFAGSAPDFFYRFLAGAHNEF